MLDGIPLCIAVLNGKIIASGDKPSEVITKVRAEHPPEVDRVVRIYRSPTRIVPRYLTINEALALGGWFSVWQMRGIKPRSSDTYAACTKNGDMVFFTLDLQPKSPPSSTSVFYDTLGFERLPNPPMRRLSEDES